VITVTELPTEAEATQSANKLAIAEGIMHDDSVMLKSLATADIYIDDQIEAALAAMVRRKNALQEKANK
jgi:hypothetical protein